MAGQSLLVLFTTLFVISPTYASSHEQAPLLPDKPKVHSKPLALDLPDCTEDYPLKDEFILYTITPELRDDVRILVCAERYFGFINAGCTLSPSGMSLFVSKFGHLKDIMKSGKFKEIFVDRSIITTPFNVYSQPVQTAQMTDEPASNLLKFSSLHQTSEEQIEKQIGCCCRGWIH